MAVWGYGRVSTEEQCMSLHMQEDAVKQWVVVNRRESEYIGFFPDENESGSKEFRKRPLGCMVHASLAPGDTIVCAQFDRMFRNAIDAMSQVKAWEAAGVSYVFIDARIDGTSPIGRLMLSVVAGIKEFERAVIRDRVRKGAKWRKELCPVMNLVRGWTMPHAQTYVPDEECRRLDNAFAKVAMEIMPRDRYWNQALRKYSPAPAKEPEKWRDLCRGAKIPPFQFGAAWKWCFVSALGHPLINIPDALALWADGKEPASPKEYLAIHERIASGGLSPSPESVTSAHLEALAEIRDMRRGARRRA